MRLDVEAVSLWVSFTPPNMKRACLAFLALACAAFGANYKFAALPKSTSVSYWDAIHTGIAKAQKELAARGDTVDVLWVGPKSEEDSAQQIALLREAVAKKVNGIVLAPCDSNTLSAPVKQALQAGIPTVVIDSGLKASGQISFIATDNYKGGTLGAKRLCSLLEGKGKVVLFRAQKGSGATESRETGFLETIKSQYHGIQVISADQYAGGSYDSAEKAATELLQKLGGDVNGIFASNDISCQGMLRALRKAGLTGKVKMVGFDATPDTVAAMRAGELQGSVVQNPIQMGYLGVMTLVAHLKGQAVEKDIDTGCVMVTPDNMEKPAIAELLKN